MENNRPKVGVGVIIKKDNKILIGMRKNTHGVDTWSFPGGHLEFNESIEDCARRETLEETGLSVGVFKKVTFTNDIFEKENKHYVSLFMITDWKDGEPEVKEPEKYEEWRWVEWNNLPKPLFLTIENLLKEGFDPFR